MKDNKLKYFIMVWLLTFSLFVIIAIGVIFKSLGYRYNSKTNKLETTGLIMVKTVPKDADVYIDEKLINGKTPLRIDKLLADSYTIKIVKEGYVGWEKKVNVEPKKALIFEDIYLFNKKSVEQEAKESDKTLFEKEITNNIQIINGSEIYIKKGLDLIFVTRFSQNINFAQSILNNRYVVYQIGSQINICDLNGQNIIPIFTLPNSDSSKTAMLDDEILLIKQNDKIYKIKVR